MFGIIGYFISGSFIMPALIGFGLGALIMGLTIALTFAMLRTTRYMTQLEFAVKELNLTEEELTSFSQEILSVQSYFQFNQRGPKNDIHPAKFIVTNNYVFFVGGDPYYMIVKLSDIHSIIKMEEQKMTYVYRSSGSRMKFYTLYGIGFVGYEFDQDGNRYTKTQMGFYNNGDRNYAFNKILEKHSNLYKEYNH